MKKKIVIISLIISAIAGIAIPLILKLIPDKKVIETNGVMIEQRAIFPGGSSSGDYTIEKGIRVRKNTN